MKRYGQVIRLKPEYEERYRQLHAQPWSGVNEMIRACNIRNYSIFLKSGFLFAYFEYVGQDFEEDMKRMAADSETIRWWKETDACQEVLESANTGEWWLNMQEIYHLD